MRAGLSCTRSRSRAYLRQRRRGRAAEGTRLLNEHTLKRVSWVRIPSSPPLPSNEASPSARCGIRKRNVPKALRIRPLHCAARELRAAFSEWSVSLPTCGLKPPPYGQKPSPLHTVGRSGRGGSSSFLWLTKPQSLPNRLLNRSSNFFFEGRRFVLCSESNLG